MLLYSSFLCSRTGGEANKLCILVTGDGGVSFQISFCGWTKSGFANSIPVLLTDNFSQLIVLQFYEKKIGYHLTA